MTTETRAVDDRTLAAKHRTMCALGDYGRAASRRRRGDGVGVPVGQRAEAPHGVGAKRLGEKS